MTASQGRLTNLSPADSAEERHDKIGDAVSDCVSERGYGHANGDMADERFVDDVDFNPNCYRRGNQPGRSRCAVAAATLIRPMVINPIS